MAKGSYPDGMPMYCGTCMVEMPTHHLHDVKNGMPTLEIYCTRNHFVTRFVNSAPDVSGEWELDMDVYKR